MSEVSVSVVIPAHNAVATLGRAVESALAQTRPPLEVIVVDDASSDGTGALAASFAARGVRLVALKRRCGAAAARNAGIRAARGSWIAFLDADDEWLQAKLARQAAAVAADTALVFCASQEFAPDGRSLGDTFRGGRASTGNDAWKALLKTNFVATPTVLAPRALLVRLGGFDERLTVGEDQDMWIRLALAGPLAYVGEELVHVHVRPRSLSAFQPADQSEYLLPMIERHLDALRGRLSKAEARAIMGERLSNAGRIALAHGDFVRGARYLLRAAFTGYRPLSRLVLLAKAPLGALAKRAFRGALRQAL